MYSPWNIAQLEEARQALGGAEIGRVSERIAGGWMTFAGVGSWANQACGLGLDGPVTEDELDRLVSFYVTRGVEPRIEVCPFVDESLIEGLARRKFQLREFENVLARKLDTAEDLRSCVVHPRADGLEILHVDPESSPQVRTFAEVSTVGFRPVDEPLSDVFEEATVKMVRHPRCDAFLACLDGVEAGGGAMEASGRIACLFGTSVVPEHRRKGIQAELIVRRLERARECGCDLAVIHSQPGIPTERNALRLGFTVAYSKVVMAMPGDGLEPSP